jgi:hypothetical protein
MNAIGMQAPRFDRKTQPLELEDRPIQILYSERHVVDANQRIATCGGIRHGRRLSGPSTAPSLGDAPERRDPRRQHERASHHHDTRILH